ncbi:MAG TPA: CDP-glucose 4,6-dehydratase [Ferruginibacter sp.]|nr:CDP-glucose 4,6-dehydratase [Ferruginibacter sp.]
MENMVTNSFNGFYEGKKIFLTGHTGFKGSWMLALLNLLGARVSGYALSPDENKNALYNVIGGDNICKSIIADIRDKEELKKAILSAQPDIIIHMAAQPLVRYSYENPVETFEVNTIGTANLLESVRLLQKKCSVIIVTTDKVYENKEWHNAYSETDRLGGYDPYSASKAAAEIVVDSYRNSFFNIDDYNLHQKAIASARAGNVIGGGDWSADRIIPDIIKALLNDQPISIRNPGAVRPWQHVLDPVAGYLLLAFKLYENPADFSGAWNFGPASEDTFSVIDLVKKMIQVWGGGHYIIADSIDQPHEAGLLKLDIKKSVEQLGWIPKLATNASIDHTIEWYKSNEKEAMTYKQLENYFNIPVHR